jgi:predicted transcriptional regulator
MTNAIHALDALGSPVRRDILLSLRTRPLSVIEIADQFPVSRPAISRHLRILEEAGLVESKASGARSLYSVRIQGFSSVRDYLDVFWDDALARIQQLARK